jgi:hypothetical protein
VLLSTEQTGCKLKGIDHARQRKGCAPDFVSIVLGAFHAAAIAAPASLAAARATSRYCWYSVGTAAAACGPSAAGAMAATVDLVADDRLLLVGLGCKGSSDALSRNKAGEAPKGNRTTPILTVKPRAGPTKSIHVSEGQCAMPLPVTPALWGCSAVGLYCALVARVPELMARALRQALPSRQSDQTARQLCSPTFSRTSATGRCSAISVHLVAHRLTTINRRRQE